MYIRTMSRIDKIRINGIDYDIGGSGGLNDFSAVNLGVDGDSITAGNQWSHVMFTLLGMNTHHNVGVGSATWADRMRVGKDGVEYTPQEFDDPNFAGMTSDTSNTNTQQEVNNCARIHVEKFIHEVEIGQYPIPDIFCFSFGTNDVTNTYHCTLGDANEALATGKQYPSGEMLYTLAGGMKWCLQKIMETYPSCKVFVLLPIQSGDVNRNNSNIQKIEVIKKIANDAEISQGATPKYLRDGLHPNVLGQGVMGKYAANIINIKY